MTGLICLWSGAIVDIPPGWVLCDGNNDTPDLRNNFIIGAGDAFNPDDAGGANTHTHTFTGDGHTHTLLAGAVLAAGTIWDIVSLIFNATGTTDPSSSLPLYYALAFIMKT